MLGSKRQFLPVIGKRGRAFSQLFRLENTDGSGGAISLLAHVCDGNTTPRLLALLSLGSLSG